MKDNAIKRYVRSSLEELSKVTWPTKNQAVRLTIIVLVFVLITAFFMGAVDYGFNELYQYVLKLTR
ncbi:preprotein translocase subunit SecE [Candidatus Peregrinibacteria bacterium]|jgi:preprotein translocase subunit SecE|nr:preprotein translocase subunit SecE [Candidatus Peregrinibacteria bacterium]MBT7736988.1 preprotein translocase subunit SecE [Candidatus Peregrinibacteria bacterium]